MGRNRGLARFRPPLLPIQHQRFDGEDGLRQPSTPVDEGHSCPETGSLGLVRRVQGAVNRAWRLPSSIKGRAMREKERSQLFIVFLTKINERLGRRVTADEPLHNMQAYNGKSLSFGDRIYTLHN